MLAAVVGIESLFLNFDDQRLLIRLVLFLLLTIGSAFFLFWNVSLLIEDGETRVSAQDTLEAD